MYEKNSQICSSCLVEKFCFPLMQDSHPSGLFVGSLKTDRKLRRGEQFIYARDNFEHLFLLRRGSIKAVTVSEQGVERIHGFYLPGELIGLEAIAKQKFTYDFIALSDAELCAIRYETLVTYCHAKDLQLSLLDMLSQQFNYCRYPHPDDSAEKRLAMFLVNMALRLHEYETEIPICERMMSWQDIGNFLGLAPATISRILKKWQNEKLLAVENKKIIFLNKKQLNILAEI